MFEENESMWKKKGFYVSVCTALVCLLAIGTVYYRMNKTPEDDSPWASVAETVAPEEPEEDQSVSNSQDESIYDNSDGEDVTGGNSISASIPEETKEPESQKTEQAKSKKKAAKSATSPKPSKKPESKAVAAQSDKKHFTFNEEKGLKWPVKGNVLLKFSMTDAVYFKTLAQYRCNPAILIGCKEGTKVKAAAAGEVLSVEKRDETGLTVTMNIGNEYTLTYGQLKNVSLKEGDEVAVGDVIGKIASPSTTYTEEGSNLYFKVEQKGEAVDPLLLLE
ncbi:MAG: M23 family metallopeptidase [Lachnospiraceae bacterium]|nr:M23 family metallopeptidase [Lachnospiraceae bacterium]